MTTERFTANVLLPPNVVLHRQAAALRNSGYEVSVPTNAHGMVVQGQATDIEEFLTTLEATLHRDAQIDDYGLAARQEE